MGEITQVPEPVQQKLKRAKSRIRRVGIYARVSTNRKAQLHSMAAQVSELTRFVSNRPEWKLTDIYLDFDSASGTKMRSEFYRMIDDAKNRKVDVIITKSIQRFGRNTVENVETMRTLVESGVVVYFQIEGIASDQPDAELNDFSSWQAKAPQPILVTVLGIVTVVRSASRKAYAPILFTLLGIERLVKKQW